MRNGEDNVLATLTIIEPLARRIERAYRLHRPDWNPGCTRPRVWSAAAALLLQLHQTDPAIPLDPELFVASQPLPALWVDPWQELAQLAAAQRFHHQVHGIIRR